MPLRQPASTPLSISTAKVDPASGVVFHHLAPLDAYVKRHTETMKQLRIHDMDNSDEDQWDVIEDNDSGCEVEEDNSQPLSPKKPLLINMPQKGSAMNEVTKAVSPGGHILKWWAHLRPVSLELLESVNQTPSPPALSQPSTSVFITLASFRKSKSNVNNPQFILPLELWLPNAPEMSHR
ncbi:hypothetical protein PAXINDRAFT_11904 [Paxillus involutus ATCC 200175]|uniref:Uncharacterized protein n=1 Tax=Paxillus involutus ATCC 200175 TaxID=664439 RepID=A0A0C9SZ20_PAXIN|nr:hypothetical protein PAXINDRAFT_11904 [Paxillus involutus ATCC 200175]